MDNLITLIYNKTCNTFGFFHTPPITSLLRIRVVIDFKVKETSFTLMKNNSLVTIAFHKSLLNPKPIIESTCPLPFTLNDKNKT